MSRQDVLALLREQEGAFVSGEEISRRLGLSRAAIWKAVDALRREVLSDELCTMARTLRQLGISKEEALRLIEQAWEEEAQ